MSKTARRIAIITGSEGSIGKALMTKFTNDAYLTIGYDIVGGNDVSSEEDAKTFFEEFVSEYGKVDVLINNAGITNKTPIREKSSLEQYKKIFDVNVKGILNMTHHALPYMTKGSSIVNIASKSAHKALNGYSVYCASKGAVVSLTRALSVELAPDIRVNSVSPGSIETDMPNSVTAQAKDELTKSIPMGRLGNPMEVARLVKEITANKYITGQDFIIDGGYTA